MALYTEDFTCFLVDKIHTFRGRYNRIFSIGPKTITTYDPKYMTATNQWEYKNFIGIEPKRKNTSNSNEFVIFFFYNERKHDSMTFSYVNREDIITEVLKHRQQFANFPMQDRLFRSTVPENRVGAWKVNYSKEQIRTILEATPCCVDQICYSTGKVISSYYYNTFSTITPVSQKNGGICFQDSNFGKLHIFVIDDLVAFLNKIRQFADKYLGISLTFEKKEISIQHAFENRLGKYSGDEHVTSLCEFFVRKMSPRHNDPVRRILCLSETCLLERDPDSYAVVTLHPLCDVFCLVRHQDNPQLLSIEYVHSGRRTYTSGDRDSLLASLVDGVRASGNLDVHVRMNETPLGKRIGPLCAPVDKLVESNHLKYLQEQPDGWSFHEAITRFNVNVPYSGLIHAVSNAGIFAENKEKVITASLCAIMIKDPSARESLSPEELEAQFHATRRLIASKAGFAALTALDGFREKMGMKITKALYRKDPGVNHAALDMLCALMQPMHEMPDLKQEQLNKTSILASPSFCEVLINTWKHHVDDGTGALVIVALLDFLTFSLCAPYSETTDGAHFDRLLKMLADNGRTLYRLFQHSSLAIVKGAGLLLKAIIEEGEGGIPQQMQQLALSEGALPRHLHTALFTKTKDGRLLTHRQLSRHLISLWTIENQTAMDVLSRTVPPGLLNTLESRDTVELDEIDRLNFRDNLKLAEESDVNKRSQVLESVDKAYRTSVKKVGELVDKHREKLAVVENRLQAGTKHLEKYYEQYLEKHVEFALHHWKSKISRQKSIEHKFREMPLILRKRREKLKTTANWPLFYYMFNRDHSMPNLIWDYKTREELRLTLEAEIRAFNEGTDVKGDSVIAWNHIDFEVLYGSLRDEIKVGGYYLRVLLDKDSNWNIEESPIKKSYEFFNDLYHRFLLAPKSHLKCMCLQAMTLVYGLHHAEIGQFNDSKYMVYILAKTMDKLERDRIILFLSKLIEEQQNVKEIMNADGANLLTDLLSLAHLHVNRAVMPVHSNVIEAAPDMKRGTAEEWYCEESTHKRAGPLSFEEMKDKWKQKQLTTNTLCWARGMDGWCKLESIPQLKWTLAATGDAVMTESELSLHILDMMIKMCRWYPSETPEGSIVRPVPKIKRLLSSAMSLPHIVQLLVTFDPLLVEKVATLLTEMLKDNPALPTVYKTGVFFFILMYTGSNVLPIAKFLHMAHMKQSFRSTESAGGDIMQQSYLGVILPEAMVCYLQNYGAEKFSEIYLGEFDTPEVIWNNEMRRFMIEKIASHVSDFTPRLLSNTKFQYQYCSIPRVAYPQLTYELFCDIYYLKHLCDTDKFPDWPIKDPVSLLKRVLVAWKSEVEKQPSSMTIEDAYASLDLDRNTHHDNAKIRKTYRRLAQQFHPDKNIDGRERFEEVSKAYEFLCNRCPDDIEGPNPKNILLIIRTQSILFSRFIEDLSIYKYSGYPMLIKTIEMEADDDLLFSKETSLLAAAAELAYHTINCSALNAEELRRERGLEILQRAYNRCVGVLGGSSRNDDVAVQVCVNVSKCYSAAALFPMCREKLLEMPHFIKDLCRTLYFSNLNKLCLVGVECICSLAVDSILQMNLLQAGALWHLLLFIFQYDYTLEESGVTKNESNNQQEILNKLAKKSIIACGRLAGLLDDGDPTPRNDAIIATLSAMLTPYVVSLIETRKEEEVLKILTSNIQTPYLIWDNGTRTQLIEFLQINQQNHVKYGEADPAFGADFVFEAHKDELIIGGIFIRVYNENPTFHIAKAKELAVELLQCIGGETQYVHSLLSLSYDVAPTTTTHPRLSNVAQALQSLANVIKNHQGVEMQCIGHFKLIFSLLGLIGCADVQRCVLALIGGVTGNSDCISDIAASKVLVYLLFAIYSPHLAPERILSLNILHSLMSNTKIVKEAVNKGAVLYLLQLFCCDEDSDIRIKTAELMGKMTFDKLVGQEVRLMLNKLLPSAIIDHMRDSPPAAVHMFEGQHENPELIWAAESRQTLTNLIDRLVEEVYTKQKNDPNYMWDFPKNISLSSSCGEVVVGGVYLRLLVTNPSWVLRKPRQFVCDVFDELLDLLTKTSNLEDYGDHIELVINTIVCVFSAQRNLLEYLPSLAHIPRVTKYLHSTCLVAIRAATLSTHQFTHSKVCNTVLESTEVVSGLVAAMKHRPDLIGVGCESLHNLFLSVSTGNELLVRQSLSANVIPFLLSILANSRLQVTNPASTKAQIVTCLKTMAQSQHSDEVTTLLEESTIWAQYRDQKHDLFLDSTPVAGYLTAGTPSVSGYLTQATRNLPTSPPQVTNIRKKSLDLP